MVVKRKLAAALLNVLVWGAGYIYVGKRTVFGAGLLVCDVVLLLPIVLYRPDFAVYLIPFATLFSLLLAYDAYSEA
ncbi:MAG: hypothetical protein QXP42_02195 [Candidatus Micrarchaeia archaeon]